MERDHLIPDEPSTGGPGATNGLNDLHPAPTEEQPPASIPNRPVSTDKGSELHPIGIEALSAHENVDRHEKKTPTVPTTRLRRSGLVILFAFSFAALSIFSLAVLCIMISHPITTAHYGIAIFS